MGKINSRAKGARGERLWRDFLRAHGFEARRGTQYSGSPDSPDVVADHPGWHCEVKNVETFQLYNALEQSTNDAGTEERPYVAHKRNKHPWVVVLRAEDFLHLLQQEKALHALASAYRLHPEPNLTPLATLKLTPVLGATTRTDGSVDLENVKVVSGDGTVSGSVPSAQRPCTPQGTVPTQPVPPDA